MHTDLSALEAHGQTKSIETCSLALSVMRKLQAVKSIHSGSYDTDTLPEGMTMSANHWPFRCI